MRKVLLYFLLLSGIITGRVGAQQKSEQALISALLASMQSQQAPMHALLYPSFDTLWGFVIRYPNPAEVQNLMANPQKLQQFDPVFNPSITKDYDAVIKKGIDSGIHWGDIIMARYELEKMLPTRDMAGINKIIDERLQGYLMVEDMLTRRSYVFTVKDILNVKKAWFGGHVVNIQEAMNIDEYYDKLAMERKMEKKKLLEEIYGVADPEPPVAAGATQEAVAIVEKEEKNPLSMNVYEQDETEKKKAKKSKEISERKYYTGTFDKETQVELYIRGIKGACPETSCSWEAMYKLVDNDEYIRLIVSRLPDGTFLFTEEPDVGSMELKLEGENFTGSWASAKDKTEYEVELTEKKEVKGNKLMKMDYIIDNELWAQ